MRKLVMVLLILVTLTVVAQTETAQGTNVETPQGTENIAAVVNGYVITKDLLNVMTDFQRILPAIKDLDEKFYNVMVNTQEGLAFLQRYRIEVLNDLINQVLIYQLAQKEGVAPSDDEIRRYVESEMEKALKDLKISKEDFEKFLEKTGSSVETLKEKLSWVYRTKKSLDNLMDKITAGATVTVEEAKDFYEKNKDVFKAPASVKLSAIVLKSEEDAKKALKLLMEGESFTKVSSEMSIDANVKKNSGEVGWIFEGTKEATELLDGYQDRVFKASIGAILGPYEINGRWYIFRVEDKKPSQEVPFDKVKDLIVEKLLQEKKKKIWLDWFKKNFEDFKKKSDIKVFIK